MAAGALVAAVAVTVAVALAVVAAATAAAAVSVAFGKAESSREVLGHIGQGDLALIVACHVAHGALTSGKLIGTENDDGVDVVLVG